MSVTPFGAYDISKCSPRDPLHVSRICMHVTFHIDALILVAELLYDVVCWYLTELVDLSFSLHFVCAPYEHDVYMFCENRHAIFIEVQVLYFESYVVTSTSMQSTLCDVADFRQYILLSHFPVTFQCHVNLLLP